MTDGLQLRRLTPEPFLPFPRAVRAGDFIFTSSIYPIDLDGRAVMGDTWLGLAGDSVITVQTRHCLAALKERLTELGSSLQWVVKVDVHLASAADFYEFKLVWRRFFPADPPARMTVEVGDTFPFPGVRVES